MLRRRRRAAPIGTIVVYHGSVAEFTGRRFIITDVDPGTRTTRVRYELSDDDGPLLRNVHTGSFTTTPRTPWDLSAIWSVRLGDIRRAAARNGCTDLIAPYLAEVRALIARGDERTARDAASALERHLGVIAITRTGPGTHRR
jgi:hypothetical protein